MEENFIDAKKECTEVLPTDGTTSFLCQNKNKVIAVAVAIVVVVLGVVIWYFTASDYAYLQKVRDQARDIAGTTENADGGGFVLDTKQIASSISYEEMTALQKTLYARQMEQALEAIEYCNEKLGFSDSLYDEMLETTAYMGARTEENDRFKVSWDYSSADGLRVKYQLN